MVRQSFLRELNMEKIVKRWSNLSLCIYISTSLLLSNLKNSVSGEILTCALDLELYQPFLGSIWFKLSPLSSLCYPLYFPRLGLRATYISAASTSMYTTCLAQVNISFLFTELKFIEHLLCSSKRIKEMRARRAVLLLFWKGYSILLTHLIVTHQPTALWNSSPSNLIKLSLF